MVLISQANEAGFPLWLAKRLNYFSDAGIDLTANLMLIGPIGLDAAVPWLAFSLLGADPVIIADGGWQEWVDQPELPLGR